MFSKNYEKPYLPLPATDENRAHCNPVDYRIIFQGLSPRYSVRFDSPETEMKVAGTGFIIIVLGLQLLWGQQPRELPVFGFTENYRSVIPAIEQDSTVVEESTNRQDSWFAFDKVQHFTFSFLWVLSTQYILVNKMHLEETEALPLSLTSSAMAGLGKELYDARKPNGWFSRRDLAADGCGILLATTIVLTGL